MVELAELLGASYQRSTGQIPMAWRLTACVDASARRRGEVRALGS